jgi:transketolase
MAIDADDKVKLEELCVNTIRFLSVDAVDKANSGHPGTPMGLADIAFVIWTEFLRHDPKRPSWENRDRFVLSAGHASMLLYSLLHLTGYEDMTIEQIRDFRQWGSITAGHPEHGHATGIEVTTGPLGQGFANAVGMGLASRMMAARFNPPAGRGAVFDPVDHFVYVICSDGDLEEGISSEASSIAGHLGLGNLIYFYDDNKISIEGDTRLAFSEDVKKRFEACGWHVQRIDGHDRVAIRRAIRKAQRVTDKPSMIIARTVIGIGSPNLAGSHEAHGAPLGAEETLATKKALGWPAEPAFLVSEEARAEFAARTKKLSRARRKWDKGMKEWRASNPELAAEWDRYWKHEVPANLADELISAAKVEKATATRAISGQVIQKLAALVPFVVGGSADLAPSNNTLIKGAGSIERREGEEETAPALDVFKGRNLHFGIREHAMGAIVNGMTLYGSWRAYGGTFLMFSDYMRPSVRLASLMKIPSIFVYTHDSVFLGEDGPTHQPVEHFFALRLIPGMTMFRPGNATEVAMAWYHAVTSTGGPTLIVLSRQKVAPVSSGESFDPEIVRQGAYVLGGWEDGDFTLVASGSELALAVAAAEDLRGRGYRPRVVSATCLDLFDRQPREVQDAVLGKDRSRIVAVEAGRSDGWYKYVSHDGLVIGIDTFGASAPAERIAEEWGFTPDAVTSRVIEWWDRR